MTIAPGCPVTVTALVGVVVTMGALAWAAVPFYGAAPETAGVPAIKAPLLIHYAELDERMAQLKRLRDTLDDCIGCGCLSVKSCPLHNPWDELGKQGAGPRLLDPD